MSQKEPTEPASNLSKLADLARQSFEQKRVKDCLDLTRAILLIDPDNADAQWMRAALQSEMQRDLEDSREFMRQAQSSQPAGPADRAMESDSNVVEPPPPTETILPPKSSGTRWPMRVAALLLLGFVAGSLLRFGLKSNPVEASLNAADRSGKNAKANPGAPPPAPVPAPAVPALSADVEIPSIPLPPPSATESQPVDQSVPAPAVSRALTKLPAEPVVTARGTLAVSSPTSVDIYKDDAYIGSAPVSLDLAAGAHTLEYRHGSLRRYMTHVVNGNETTKAMVTFEVSVQINSKPWADVFVDGTERKALGQTPLSGVRVPIGSVLVFENPKFQTKRYRVTGNETGIQIVFP